LGVNKWDLVPLFRSQDDKTLESCDYPIARAHGFCLINLLSVVADVT
jgi:hypothetical protein